MHRHFAAIAVQLLNLTNGCSLLLSSSVMAAVMHLCTYQEPHSYHDYVNLISCTSFEATCRCGAPSRQVFQGSRPSAYNKMLQSYEFRSGKGTGPSSKACIVWYFKTFATASTGRTVAKSTSLRALLLTQQRTLLGQPRRRTCLLRLLSTTQRSNSSRINRKYTISTQIRRLSGHARFEALRERGDN